MIERTSKLFAIAALLLLWGGLTRAAPPHYDDWECMGVEDGLPSDKILAVLATEEGVWAGTDHGLALYRDGAWSVFTTEDGLVHDAVLALARDERNGALWIATMGGLSRYSAGRFQNYTQLNSGLVNDVIYGVTVHRGEVWAATAAGASRYEMGADRWSIYDESNAPMHEIWCYSSAGDGDRIYVAVWGGGLLEFDLERERWKHYRDPDGEMEIDLFKDDGLVHDIVTGVSVDARQWVWIGTYFGLSSYDGRNWRNFFDHDSPLVSNFVNYVYARGEMCWIATDDGLSATDRENWWNYRRDPDTGEGTATWHPVEGPEETIRLRSVFPHNYTLGVSIRGNEMWLATEGGIARGRLTHERASIAPSGGEAAAKNLAKAQTRDGDEQP